METKPVVWRQNSDVIKKNKYKQFEYRLILDFRVFPQQVVSCGCFFEAVSTTSVSVLLSWTVMVLYSYGKSSSEPTWFRWTTFKMRMKCVHDEYGLPRMRETYWYDSPPSQVILSFEINYLYGEHKISKQIITTQKQ
jgi:hypothetical protein